MPIRIIRDSERFTAPLDGGVLHYRRVPSHVRQDLEHRYTTRGVLDRTAWFDAMLEYALVGWENVCDTDGSPLAFDKALVKYLPEDTKVSLVGLLGLADPGEQALLGNSNGSLRPVQRLVD